MQPVQSPPLRKTSLPPEILLQIFMHGDFTPDILLVVARGLSKSDNGLSLVARSPDVWRDWHPEAVVRDSLAHPGSEDLALRYLKRVRGYPSDVRKALALSYKTQLAAPPALQVDSLNQLAGPAFLQMYDLIVSQRKNGWLFSTNASVWPPDHLRMSTADDLQSFDSTLARLRWDHSDAPGILRRAHESFWDEQAFVNQALKVSASYSARASARLQENSPSRTTAQDK